MEIKTILELADKAGFNVPELEKGFANLLRQRLIDFANLVEAHDRLAQPEPELKSCRHCGLCRLVWANASKGLLLGKQWLSSNTPAHFRKNPAETPKKTARDVTDQDRIH